jgi:hypothetical protein
MSKKTREERKFNQELTLHHRRPISIGGSRNDQRNHSWVPRNKHQAWHTCFGTNEAPIICSMINLHYLDSQYEFICVKRK